MRVLVTGATGRIGSRLVPRLLRAGEDVTVLARDRDRARPAAQAGAQVVIGDLLDGARRREALADATAVLHLAAAFRGVSPDVADATSRGGASALARDALDAGVTRFVFTSTSQVYGPGRGRPVTEADEVQPPTGAAYPTAKAAAEADLGALVAEGLDLRILRLAFVYGDGDPHLGESLMWAKDWPAHQRLHMVHHADVACAVLRALRAPGLNGLTVNIGDDAPATSADLHTLNRQQLPEGAADRQLDDPWTGILDTRSARANLGWRPTYPSVWAALDAGAL